MTNGQRDNFDGNVVNEKIEKDTASIGGETQSHNEIKTEKPAESEKLNSDSIKKESVKNSATQSLVAIKERRFFGKKDIVFAVCGVVALLVIALCAMIAPPVYSYYNVATASKEDIMDSMEYTAAQLSHAKYTVVTEINYPSNTQESVFEAIVAGNKMYDGLTSSYSDSYSEYIHDGIILKEYPYGRIIEKIENDDYHYNGLPAIVKMNKFLAADFWGKDRDFSNTNKYNFWANSLRGNKIMYCIDTAGFDYSELIHDLSNGNFSYFGEYNLSYRFTVCNKTRVWESMEFTFFRLENNEKVELSFKISLDDFGQHITLDIPHDIFMEINFYKDSQKFFANNNNQSYEISENKYTNTANDVVKYYNVGEYIDVAYDRVTNKYAVLRKDSVDIYSGENIALLKTINFDMTANCLDIDNGKLAVGFGDGRQAMIYDLDSYKILHTIVVDYGNFYNLRVDRIIIDGDMVIVADNYNGNVFFYDLTTQTHFKEKSHESNYSVHKLAIDRANHLLYIVYDHYYACVDSQTGTVIMQIFHYIYNFDGNGGIFFDGKYLHYSGFVYSTPSSQIISKNGLNKNYTPNTAFTERRTLLETDAISLVFGFGEDFSVGIYDNIQEKYLYFFDFWAGEKAEIIDETKIFISSISNKYIAIIDLDCL